MIDTVRLTAQVPPVRAGDLLQRGWTMHVSTSPQGEVNARAVWAEEGDPVRLSVLLGLSWLAVEASLPRLVCGDNAQVISEESEVRRAVELMKESAIEHLGDRPSGDWRCTRVDPVWAWPTDPAPYIAALRWARLPRTSPVVYSDGLQWRGRRSVRGRMYNKAIERGHAVDLPLRFERQVRPRAHVVKVAGKRLGVGVEGCTSWATSREVLMDGLHELGLDRSIPTMRTARERLRERYGARRGSTLFGWLVARELDGVPPPGDPRTVRRYEAELRAAGVTGIAEAVELPPLELPE